MSADLDEAGRDAMLVARHLAIPMDDGIVLYADIFRPNGPLRYPAIVSHGPCGMALAAHDLAAHDLAVHDRAVHDRAANDTQVAADEPAASSALAHAGGDTAPAVDPEKWVPCGYACVRIDARGTGRSTGRPSTGEPREQQDLHTCIEWIAGQSWCSGRVGLSGAGHHAASQWRVAVFPPSQLAAICVWEAWADCYRDRARHGGIVCTFERKGGGAHIRSDAAYRSGPEDPCLQFVARPMCDEWYAQRSADLDRMTVPLLSAANWGGQVLHARGNFEAFMRAASRQKWLEVHGGTQLASFHSEHAVRLQRRFFDHFLKGEANGWDRQPPVLLGVRHADGRVVARDEQQWPLARTRWTALHLDLATRRLDPIASNRTQTVTYDALGDGLTFITLPLEADTEISGPVATKLFVSSSTADADVFVVLRVFAPGGAELLFEGATGALVPVAQGCLRASHRTLDARLSTPWRPCHTHDVLKPLAGNEVAELDIEIVATSIVVPAGYRLALSVRGRDFDHSSVRQAAAGDIGCSIGDDGRAGGDGPDSPLAAGAVTVLHDDPIDRPMSVFGGKVTLHAGAGRMPYLLLPVIPALDEASKP